MDEVTLRVVQRSMPGHGRARIHSNLLTTLGISDNDEIEVTASNGTSITLTVFADKLVENTHIRISEDDLKKLRIKDGDEVRARRKIPVSEHVKGVAGDIADRVSKGVKDIGDTVSEKTTGLKEGSIQAAQDISSKAKDVSAKIVEEVRPIGEKISETGKETAAKIHELVPTSRFNAQVESGMKRLSQKDAADLKKILLRSEGEIHAVTVKAPVSGRTIQNLTLPPDVTIVAVQREDNTLVPPDAGTTILTGDVVYLTGDVKGLDYMTTILEG